jgi:hypothetical protein
MKVIEHNKIIKSIAFLFLVLVSKLVVAQTMPINNDSLKLNADPRITTLQDKYIELNKLKQTSSG